MLTHLSTLFLTIALLGPAVPDPEGLRGLGAWPLQPVPAVVDGFDAPDSPWGAGHRGVDLAGAPGQRVRAALPGRVTFAGFLAGRGVVVVSHGLTRTTYEPVTATVSVGELIAAGAPVGRLTLPGSHCAPRACLHWGWLAGEVYLDPLELVGAGRVRLLPLAGLGSAPTAQLRATGPIDQRPSHGDASTEPEVLLPGLLAITRVGVLVGRPSGAARS